MSAYIFDYTALLALDAGHHGLSRLVAVAHSEAEHHLYTPALCIAAAAAKRPRLADHIGALPAITVIEMGYAAASGVGNLLATKVDWRIAQAVNAARPTPDWPDGRPVLTTTPRRYAKLGVRTITVSD